MHKCNWIYSYILVCNCISSLLLNSKFLQIQQGKRTFIIVPQWLLACLTGFSAQDLTSRCHQFCHQDLEEVEFLSGDHRVEALLDLSDFLVLEDRGLALLVYDQHGGSFGLFEVSFISHQCFPHDLWAESDA